MCYSKAEGGVRCHSHTKQGYESARARRADVLGNPEASPSAVERANTRYGEKVGDYAAHWDPRAHEALTQRLFALDTGATPDGDDAEVIRAALDDNPAPAPKATAKKAKKSTTRVVSPEEQAVKEARAAELHRAMSTSTPAVDTPETRRPTTPRDTSVLGGLLQTGGLRDLTADDHTAVAVHGTTHVYGHVTVPAAQREWVEPWGPSVPVDVDVVADVKHNDPDAANGRAGFLQRLLGNKTRNVAPSKWTSLTPDGYKVHEENRDHDHPDHRHGTLTTHNSNTGERRYYRAIDKNGTWEIQYPIT